MQPIERRVVKDHRLGEHRRSVVERLKASFPAEVTDLYHGLADAEELVKNGHGLVIAGSHFSYRDGPGVFLYVAAASDELIDKLWLAPVARHIYEVTAIANFLLGTKIDLKPVVTASTVTKQRFRHSHRGQGLRGYIEGATTTLEHGGVVALFPQSTRMSYLGEPGEFDKAMEFLMTRTTKAEVNDFGILPVGFGIKGAEDYTKYSGLNKGVSYEVNIGRLWLKDEVLKSTADSNRSLDGWVTDQLKLLVSEHYRKIPQAATVYAAERSE